MTKEESMNIQLHHLLISLPDGNPYTVVPAGSYEKATDWVLTYLQRRFLRTYMPNSVLQDEVVVVYFLPKKEMPEYLPVATVFCMHLINMINDPKIDADLYLVYDGNDRYKKFIIGVYASNENTAQEIFWSYPAVKNTWEKRHYPDRFSFVKFSPK